MSNRRLAGSPVAMMSQVSADTSRRIEKRRKARFQPPSEPIRRRIARLSEPSPARSTGPCRAARKALPRNRRTATIDSPCLGGRGARKLAHRLVIPPWRPADDPNLWGFFSAHATISSVCNAAHATARRRLCQAFSLLGKHIHFIMRSSGCTNNQGCPGRHVFCVLPPSRPLTTLWHPVSASGATSRRTPAIGAFGFP